MDKKTVLGKSRTASTRMVAGMTRVETTQEKMERSLFREGCNCWYCSSKRRMDLSQADRQLAEAAASGDETWYDQVMKQRVAILR